MIQLSGLLSGFALYSLFVWMPIWNLASAKSAEEIFRYFVVVMMLVFGIFMVSGGKTNFTISKFGSTFAAGCMLSIGYSTGLTWLLIAGIVTFAASWMLLGE